MKKYVPTDGGINGLNNVAYSSYIPLGGMVGSVTSVIATLAGAPVISGTVGLMGCIGIAFFQLINGDYYLLNAENSMRLEDVF